MHVLGTPPAFILSQDQTLVKSVCIQSRIAWQFCSFLLFLGLLNLSIQPFLKNLLKNFQGCCLLFSYQCSLLFCLATAILDYHIFKHLSRLFSFFLCCSFLRNSVLPNDSLFRISHLSTYVNNFFLRTSACRPWPLSQSFLK